MAYVELGSGQQPLITVQLRCCKSMPCEQACTDRCQRSWNSLASSQNKGVTVVENAEGVFAAMLVTK